MTVFGKPNDGFGSEAAVYQSHSPSPQLSMLDISLCRGEANRGQSQLHLNCIVIDPAMSKNWMESMRYARGGVAEV